MNTQQYYKSLKELQANIAKQFPNGYLLVTSTEHPGPAGSSCEVSVSDCARLLTEGSHRLASDEETVKYQADMDTRRGHVLSQRGIVRL